MNSSSSCSVAVLPVFQVSYHVPYRRFSKESVMLLLADNKALNRNSNSSG